MRNLLMQLFIIPTDRIQQILKRSSVSHIYRQYVNANRQIEERARG